MENELARQTEISLCSAEIPEKLFSRYDSSSLASWVEIACTAHARPGLQKSKQT